MSPSVAPLLLKKPEVCERLNVSQRTLEGMVNDGTFPPSERIGKFVYWSNAAVLTWMTRKFGPQEAWSERPNEQTPLGETPVVVCRSHPISSGKRPKASKANPPLPSNH